MTDKPPTITFSTDIFHPLVSPLTTYTYTTSDTGANTVSATDDERLPPGGFSLQHAFPQWYGRNKRGEHDVPREPKIGNAIDNGHSGAVETGERPGVHCGPIEIVQVLYYMRSAFVSEHVLDEIPLEASGNPSAWQAWHTHRAKAIGAQSSATDSDATDVASPGVRQQPGGARRPGQWNWDGVWEERVRKGVQASISQHALYGGSGPGDELVGNSCPKHGLIADCVLHRLRSWMLIHRLSSKLLRGSEV